MQSLDNYVEKKTLFEGSKKAILGSQQTEIIMHKILQAFFYFLQRFPFFSVEILVAMITFECVLYN